MHARTELGRFRWGYLVAVIGLVLTLFLPALTAAQGIKDRPGDDPATEEATEDPFDEATEEATEEPFDPATEEATEEATGEAGWEDAGLVGTRSYESPQFAYTVDWSRDWDVDVAIEEINDHPPVMSDEVNEQDTLYLIWSPEPGQESYAIFAGQTANRGGPDGDVEEWLDPDWIEGNWNANYEIEPLLDDTTRSAASVLYSVLETDDDLQYYTVYQSIELDDGTTLYLTFSAYEDWFEDSYISWSEDVEINGEPLDVVFDWADIEDAI